MKKSSTSTNLYSDLELLRAKPDGEIDRSEIPEATSAQMSRAILRVGGRRIDHKKIRVNIYLDADLIAYYKAQSGGKGYQTLINDALRANIRNQELETTLRRVIQEELRQSA